MRGATKLAIAASVAAACANPAPKRAPVAASTPVALDARVPSSPRAFAPSRVIVEGAISGRDVADVDRCDGCHADVVAMWRSSAHAFASFNNPVYRASIDQYRAEVGDEKSRFCGGCHDVALLVDGALDRDVAPADLRAHAGVTCVVCHSIRDATLDGNGSYTLASDPIPIPKPGDDASLAAHRARLALPPLGDGVKICASCHRSFLDESTGNERFLAGQDEVTAWSRSAYAGSERDRVDEPIERKDCRGCHMPREAAPLGDVSAKGGRVASHRFLGGQTWLAAMRRDTDQLARVRSRLEGAATIDVAAATDASGQHYLPAESAPPPAPETTMVFDVVVKNTNVGHRFPGGVLDAQATWVDVTVADRDGKIVAKTSEDDRHELRALVADRAGRPLHEREVNRFRAVVANHTIAPRDAEVIEVAFTMPARFDERRLPLVVTATLRHRSRDEALHHLACASSKTDRGRAFAEKTPLDACVDEPVTEIATSSIAIGARGGTSKPSRPEWSRLLDLGEALASHLLQERLEEARPSLVRASDLLGTNAAPRDRARAFAALGVLEAREGRTAEALAMFDRAEAVDASTRATIAALRGDALSDVWRWKEAAPLFAIAAGAFPRDDGAWARLAIATSSAGDDRAALEASLAGLALAPREPDLLRVQAVSLAALHADDALVANARAAFDEHRAADDAPRIRAACSRDVPGCALERVQVHRHALVTLE